MTKYNVDEHLLWIEKNAVLHTFQSCYLRSTMIKWEELEIVWKNVWNVVIKTEKAAEWKRMKTYEYSSTPLLIT